MTSQGVMAGEQTNNSPGWCPIKGQYTHLRLLSLPWTVTLLLLPFVYDLQGIPLPKRLPPNPRPSLPVSLSADHEQLNRKPWKIYYNRIYTDPFVQRVRYVLAHCDDLTFT